jgi:hypothetical protein
VSIVANPHALPLLQELHYSAVHFTTQLTGRQFRAFPTSYTAVFRSIVWKLDLASVGVFDELAGVHALARNVPTATQLLES